MRRTAIILALACIQAQNTAVPVQMVVTVEGHHGNEPANLTRDDVMVYHDKERRQVTGWTPVRSAGVELWILIDDGTDASIGNQFGDLRKMLLNVPSNYEVGLGYMRNGVVNAAQPLTSDHELAAKALRLPLAEAGIDASPYMAVTDLILKWPPSQRAREVLMVAGGADLYYGPGPQNPYLQRAIAEAQRAAVVVNSIYFGSAGHSGHSYWQITWGQNNLSQLSEETGGEFYWQGMSNPVSFGPFLDQFTHRLNNQFLLTFLTPPHDKPELESVKVRTEIPQVSLVAPSKAGVARLTKGK